MSGRIVYVEAVDPDGDGDAHFVLADSDGVTGFGISVVDVRADLRPQPLPGVGDQISAAGPVATGSFGSGRSRRSIFGWRASGRRSRGRDGVSDTADHAIRASLQRSSTAPRRVTLTLALNVPSHRLGEDCSPVASTLTLERIFFGCLSL